MNYIVKIMTFFVAMHIGATSIAAPINPALLSRKDTFAQYLLKKVPGNVRFAVEQYLKQHPKLTAMGKHIYEYRYVIGSAALLGGYYAGAPHRGIARRMFPPSGGEEPIAERPKKLIDFDELPNDVRNDQLLSHLNRLCRGQMSPELRIKSIFPQWTGSDTMTVGNLLAILIKELHNPAEKQLFLDLKRRFGQSDSVSTYKFIAPIEYKMNDGHGVLKDNFDTYYSDDASLYFLSQHPFQRALLDPYLSDVEVSPPIYAEIVDNSVGVLNVALYHKIIAYWPKNQYNKTFFENNFKGVSSTKRLFAGVLYKFIKVVARYPKILIDLQDKTVVVDYDANEKISTNPYAKNEFYANILGVIIKDENTSVGKNFVGRMITYIVQQMFLPENRELLKAITKRYYDVPTKVLERKGVIPDLRNIIFQYRGPVKE